MYPLLPPNFLPDNDRERERHASRSWVDAGSARPVKTAFIAALLLLVALVALAIGGPRLALWYAGQRLINAIPLVDDARRWSETVDNKPECGAIWIRRGYVTELSEQQIIDFSNAHHEDFPTGSLNPGFSSLGRYTISFGTWRATGDGTISSGSIEIVHPGQVDLNDHEGQTSLDAQRDGKTFFTTGVLYVNDIDKYEHGPCFHD